MRRALVAIRDAIIVARATIALVLVRARMTQRPPRHGAAQPLSGLIVVPEIDQYAYFASCVAMIASNPTMLMHRD